MLNPTRALAALLTGSLLLGSGSSLWADEKRIYTNNSDAAWTLELFQRAQKEKANMYFNRDGNSTKLGEDSTVKILTLPPHSRFEVEFTHSNRAFYHALQLTDGTGHWARFTVDYPWPALKFNRPPVELAYQGSSLAQLDPEAIKPFITINTPAKGDLTILRDNLITKSQGRTQTFGFINKTGDEWQLNPAPRKAVPGKGGLSVYLADGSLSALGTGGARILPLATLRVQFTADASGRYDQCFRIANAKRGAWVLRVYNDPGKPYPDEVRIERLEGDWNTPWVFANGLSLQGSLEIDDPEREADFGVE